jgi:hypothetical protein
MYPVMQQYPMQNSGFLPSSSDSRMPAGGAPMPVRPAGMTSGGQQYAAFQNDASRNGFQGQKRNAYVSREEGDGAKGASRAFADASQQRAEAGQKDAPAAKRADDARMDDLREKMQDG